MLIEEHFAIPAACQERFLPVQFVEASALRDRAVFMGGISDVVPGYAMGRPAPMFHMVLYGLEGCGRLTTPEGSHALAPDTLMIAPVGCPYGFAPEGRHWRFMWLHLEDAPQWAFLRAAGIVRRPAYTTLAMAGAMEGLLHEGVRREADSGHAIRLWAMLIGLYLDRELHGGGQPHEHLRRHRLYQLWDAVNADLRRRWTVREMAEAVRLSPTHFHRTVAAATGMTPMQMVTRLRMERARELVVQQDFPLQWVAEQVGYESAFSLSTAFKRHWGASPRAYRRRPR